MSSDLTPRIAYPAGMSDEWTRLRGSAAGRRLFLLGSGPSAGEIDLERLRGELTVSVNHFGLHPRIAGIVPDFHIVADPAAFDPAKPLFFDETLETLSFLDRVPTRLVLPFDFAGAILDHPRYRAWNPLFWRYGGDPARGIDFSRPVPTWGQNVLDVCLMFALHLGAAEVHLIGFDNGGVVSRFGLTPHFYEQRAISKAAEADYTDADLERCMYSHLRQLHSLRRLAADAGMAIFTCARHGTFRMFPVVDFEELTGIPPGAAGPDVAGASDTVPGRILARCAEGPSRPALHLLGAGGWTTVDRAALGRSIEDWRDRFAALGRPGELVLFLKRTDLDLVAAYVGAMAAGMVPAQMAPPTSKVAPAEYARRLGHILSTTGSRVVFADDGFELPADAGPVLLLTPSAPSPDVSSAPPGRRAPNGSALAQFSSGTTGLQKAVFLRHGGILAHMRAYAPALGLSDSDTIVSWLPLYHDMGLVAAYLMPLLEGVPVALMDPFAWIARPELLGEAAERFGGTIAFLPNFAYHVLARAPRHRGMERFRLLVNCSEPARSESHALLRSACPEIAEETLSVCYALAENTFAVSQTPAGTSPRILSAGGRELLSCGRILPGTEVRVREPGEDGIGELEIRGECLFAGFLDGEDRMVDGFYPTGDLGLVDGGEVFVAGRKKDLIIVRGRNIHPQDVEHVAGHFPGVHPGRAACIGLDVAETGSQELVVLLEPEDPSSTEGLPAAVGRAVEQEVGTLPRKVLVVPKGTLVKTSSGKMSRSRIKELYLQGTWEKSPC